MGWFSKQPSQEICLPVTEGFDANPQTTIEMMQWEGAARQGIDIAAQLEATNALSTAEFESGLAAERTIRELGCDACTMAGCTVFDALSSKVELGRKESTTQQLLAAPKWLNAARVKAFGQTRFNDLAGNSDKLKATILSGELNPRDMLGGLESEVVGLLRTDQVPQLESLHTKPDATVESHIVRKESTGKAFEVIDASDAIDISEDPAPAEELGVLYQKLLDRMFSKDAVDAAQIFSSGNTMQRPISAAEGRITDGRLDEIRMGGKNRLYVIITPSSAKNELPRIVIVGSHGGDASTQNKFIGQALSLKAVVT